MSDVAIITALGTAILGLSTFISYLVKRALDDKDRQIDRWQAAAEKDAATAKSALAVTHEILGVAKESDKKLSRIERELAAKGGRRAADGGG